MSADPLQKPLIAAENASPARIPEQAGVILNEIAFETPENVEEEGKIVRLLAYETSALKTSLYFLLSLATAGFYFLLCKWYIKLKIKSTLSATSVAKAQFLLVFCLDETFELIPVRSEWFTLEKPVENKAKAQGNAEIVQINEPKHEKYATFEYRLFKYYYDPVRQRFLPIRFSLNEFSNYQIHENYGRGLQDEQVYKEKRSLYGANSTEVPEKPITRILMDEILSPFYLFQIFSCVLWYYDEYQIYASVILGTTVVSILMTLWDAYHNMKNLRKMSYFETQVNVFRGVQGFVDTSSKEKTDIKPEISEYRRSVSSLELVPGDIIEVPENCVIPCDLILLNGSCIMNECMLTGTLLIIAINIYKY